MVAPICEYTKNHLIVYFKLVNCMVCNLCLNKTAGKERGEEAHFLKRGRRKENGRGQVCNVGQESGRGRKGHGHGPRQPRGAGQGPRGHWGTKGSLKAMRV